MTRITTRSQPKAREKDMSQWIQLRNSNSGSTSKIRRKLQQTTGVQQVLVTDHRTTLVRVSNKHSSGPWLDKIASDYSARVEKNVAAPGASVETPCGLTIIASAPLGRHVGKCKRCLKISERSLIDNIIPPRATREVVKVRPPVDVRAAKAREINAATRDAAERNAAAPVTTTAAIGTDEVKAYRKRLEKLESEAYAICEAVEKSLAALTLAEGLAARIKDLDAQRTLLGADQKAILSQLVGGTSG
jgi:protein tyrosine phosphatase (PTP) superfamily phosphohydrolase (DUF442 family)